MTATILKMTNHLITTKTAHTVVTKPMRIQKLLRKLEWTEGAKKSLRSPETSPNTDKPMNCSHRERRERFARTKSEGSIKLRVTFSRAIEADDDLSDASPELSRRRAIHEGAGLGGESFATRYERRHGRYQRWASDNTTSPQAAPRECEENIPRGTANVDHPDFRAGTSSGAIPKRKSYRSYDSTSSDENDFRRRRVAAKSSSPDSAIGESLPNTQTVSRDRSPSLTDHDKPDHSDCEDGIIAGKSVRSLECESNEGDLRLRVETKTSKPILAGDPTRKAREDNDELQYRNRKNSARDPNTSCSAAMHLSSSEEDVATCRGAADDIESIIEKIIAEEEHGRLSSIDSSLVNRMGEMLGPDACKYEREMEELQESIDDCNRETSFSLEMSRRENEMSISAPLTGFDDQRHSATLMSYSSSYPPRKTSYQGGQENASDEDEDEEAEDQLSSWANLPMILMEDVLTLLTPKERHLASQVCRQWYDLFYSPRVWETFILLERTLTKKRFNLYKGYQRELCPGKTQICFRRVGSFFKRIVVTPITDYFNLYEFLRILASFLQSREDQGEPAMPLLHTFDFTFACATRADGGVIIHGTGGQILEMIKELLTRMKDSLRHLKLNQLLLESSEVPSLFNALVHCFCDCLHSLEMLNVTKVPLPLEELASFRNLIKLVMSPQNLNDESILMLSGINLLQLHLLQDPYTCVCDPVSSEAWKLAREVAPWLRVYLEVAGNTKAQLLIQPRAPVHGIFLRSSHGSLTHGLIMAVVENYGQTLRYFVQERLPRTHGPRGFEHRCDSALLFLVRRCPRLHTLVIRERISTATLLLLATEGKGLKTLLVRHNALIKKCDWPQRGEFPVEFYKWLKRSSLDYQMCTDEISATLRRRWRPMSDRQFMHLKIIPRLEMF
ncbi:hypothetical protein EGW08_007097 [Elysia chlorotica]|uniref:F-box domain-containing protein n=1 Tax=Elysia chlorotica TaxID=188477 RepID=A0A3S0ZRL5_ELYCH|nr:hypothetical protein EGW08_007097 [Elysia chlorotica]